MAAEYDHTLARVVTQAKVGGVLSAAQLRAAAVVVEQFARTPGAPSFTALRGDEIRRVARAMSTVAAEIEAEIEADS